MTEGGMFSKGSETDGNKEGGTVSKGESTTPVLVTEEMAARAGFNVKSPIVNAVVKNVVELSTKKTERGCVEKKRCSLCNVACYASESDRVNHFLGKKHRNKMWSLRIIKNLNRIDKRKKVVNPAKGEYKCQLCQVTVNSPIQLISHMMGTKHINSSTQTGVVLSARPLDDLSHPTVTYFCQHCQIHINSHKQVLKHKYSPLHKINLERNNRVRKKVSSYW